MTKIARNAPCPCGSGRKYKRCCLAKDEAKGNYPAIRLAAEARIAAAQLEEAKRVAAEATTPERSIQETRPLLNGLLSKPVPPKIAVWDAMWERFEATDYEGRIATFLETLDQGTLDAETAFTMLNDYLADEARAHGDQARFAELVAKLAQQAPEVYEVDAIYYSSILIEDAVRARRFDRLPSLLDIYARQPTRGIDEFFSVKNKLLYYGQLKPVKDVMMRAWPAIFDSSEILPWGKDEYAGLLTALIVFDYLASTPAPRLDDPTLRNQLAQIKGRDKKSPEGWFRILLGERRDWKPRHFLLKDRENLFLLGWDWLGEMYRKHGLPLAKGDLARQLLTNFYVEQGKSGRAGSDLLIPKRKPLDEFLGKTIMSLLHVDYYPASALMELLPLYLTFLVERGLITQEVADRAVEDLRPLVSSLLDTLKAHNAEPGVGDAVKRSWEGL